MVNTDVVGYCSPDCGKCGPAFGDLPGNCWEALLFFFKFRWATECKQVGEKQFGQYPDYACWYNCPLCLAVCCVPCCWPVVWARNMEKITGKSCESECLTCAVLSACCCMNMCYYAKQRTAFREKYGLVGSPCCDCFCVPCSQMCYTCVDANELMERGGYEVPFCGAKAATMIRGATGGNALTAKVAETHDNVSQKIKDKVTPNRT